MEETAYFLNLVVKSDKPVVLTGSMRPSTSLSADGPLNIYNAVGVASDPRAKGRGVLVVANDDIHSARAITKRHTTDVETFVSPEVGLIGVCLFDDREFSRSPARAHTKATPFTVSAGQTLPRVDVIYAHAGMSPDLIDAAVANGAKGLVIAGVGDGNMTTAALDAVKRAIGKGVVVVRSTRVGEGIVRRNIEVDDDKIGTVVSKELNPAKARVLLKLGLTQSTDPRSIQDFFDRCTNAMDPVTLRQYETLSPFEIKNDLAAIAAKSAGTSQMAYLNAGRGNPNWIATEPRSAFFLLGQFAMTESRRVLCLPVGVGGMPKAPGMAARLVAWLGTRESEPGAAFLRNVIPWAIDTFGFVPDTFVHELVDAIVGDNYPVPDRMPVHNELIVREYLQWAMCGQPRPAGPFRPYAVDGGTAAMCYIFKSLPSESPAA